MAIPLNSLEFDVINYILLHACLSSIGGSSGGFVTSLPQVPGSSARLQCAEPADRKLFERVIVIDVSSVVDQLRISLASHDELRKAFDNERHKQCPLAI